MLFRSMLQWPPGHHLIPPLWPILSHPSSPRANPSQSTPFPLPCPPHSVLMGEREHTKNNWPPWPKHTSLRARATQHLPLAQALPWAQHGAAAQLPSSASAPILPSITGRAKPLPPPAVTDVTTRGRALRTSRPRRRCRPSRDADVHCRPQLAHRTDRKSVV